MLLGRFAAPQNGFLGSICGPPRADLRPPLFETTVFIARNGFLCGVRKPNILTVFGFLGFFNNAILEVVEVVFLGPNKFSFFACVSGLGSSRRSSKRQWDAKRFKTRGFGAILRCRAWLNCVGPVVAPSCCSPFLTQFCRRLTNLLFRKFEFLTKLVLDAKRRPGAAEPRRF